MSRPSVFSHGGNRCDLCNAFFVFKLYACFNFDWYGRAAFPQGVGHVAVCERCSKLVDDDRWEALARKAKAPEKRRFIREVGKRLVPARAALIVLQARVRKGRIKDCANLC